MWETQNRQYEHHCTYFFIVVVFPYMVGQSFLQTTQLHRVCLIKKTANREKKDTSEERETRERCSLNRPALLWAGQGEPLLLSAQSCFLPALSHFGKGEKWLLSLSLSHYVALLWKRLRLLCFSSRGDTLCSLHFGNYIYADKKFCRDKNLLLSRLFFSKYFFLSHLAIKPIVLLFSLIIFAVLLLAGPSPPVSDKLYLFFHVSIWFYVTEFKTKGYVQILAALRRDRAAAKDPAGIQKSQAEWSTKKKKKKTPPFPLLGHKFHFLCSQPCAATPPHPHLTAFNLLPFLSCRTFF